MSKLYMINGPMEGHTFGIKKKTTYIGRSSKNDIQIKDPSVSRSHMKVIRRNGKFFIEDQKSRNGTWFNGSQLKPLIAIQVEEGLPIAVGNIFVILEAEEEDGTVTQYTIDLSKQILDGQKNLLYKDQRITDRKRLELIHEVATFLMQTLDIDEICEKIMHSLFSCLKRIDSGVILLGDEESKELRQVISRSRMQKNVKIKYSRTMVNKVLRQGKAIMISDTNEEEAEDLSESIEKARIKSIMCVPLVSKSRIRGVIYVHSVQVPGGFRKDDLHFLTALSSPVALAIENALLYKKRRETEEALRESEEKYRILVENANDAILVVQKGKIVFSNPITRTLFGYLQEELEVKPFADLFHPEERDLMGDRQERRAKGENLTSAYSLRARNNAGHSLWVQINDITVQWDGKPATLNIIRDVTKQKRMEEQLLQSQKMEAIRNLAGGIAYDFNNLLMGIQGNTSLLQLDTEAGHIHSGKLKSIEKYVKSGAELTEQLSSFASDAPFDLTPTDMNDLINKCLEMFGPEKKGLTPHKEYQQNLWSVDVAQRQMEHVLLNLCINAWQAMPDGGNLIFKTENIALVEEEARILGVDPGKYVKLVISDTGSGIDEMTRKRIFEPFFSTREMGRGTGLGLAFAYGTIRGHGGIIHVESEKEKGTSFSIFLPSNGQFLEKQKQSVQKILRGKETVLLVDDEDMIIDVASQMMERLGYEVITSRSGKEAIDLYRKSNDKIDLVILDMGLSDMSGDETVHRLKEINANAKVLFSSGYSIDEQSRSTLALGIEGFLQKPFNLVQLSQKLREVLDQS
ncbi:MAG: PAS domain S-box protein [Deltaproteobacteria bacterium]|nr:PAS domain S-box protein [Deltaproteobacteria bacterium]